MSEKSSRFDWFCQLTAERLAQASGNAPTSETGVGLLPLNLVDEHQLRMALDALGVVIDAEPICLLDPRWWGDRVPQNPKLTPDVSLLSEHQWRRSGKGKRAGPAATHVVAMWHQRLHQLAQALEDGTVLCLLGHSEPTHDRALAPCDSDLRIPTCALSTLYPISADAFITLAASVGLFCVEPPAFLGDANGTCERALYGLSRREYAVRFARTTDIDSLERLEELCGIPPLRSPKQSLLTRIETFQQGQFVLERDGEVKGVFYSQRISDDAELGQRTIDNVHQRHEPTGDVVQLLAVNIDPDSQHLARGDQLLEFMLPRSSLQRGVRKIVAVTWCKDFAAEQGCYFEEYVAGVGRERDRILHFHHLHGAEIAAVLPGYRPRDIANEGKGGSTNSTGMWLRA